MKHWPLLLITVPFLFCIVLTIYVAFHAYRQTRLAEKANAAGGYLYASQKWLEENPLSCDATSEEIVSSLQEMERQSKFNGYSTELIVRVSRVEDNAEILLIYPGPDGQADFFNEEQYRKGGRGLIIGGGEAGLCFQVKCN